MVTRKPAVAHVDGQEVAFRGGLSITHQPLRTPQDAESMANAMVASGGNYPPGMDVCLVAGINGDQIIEDHCIFDEHPECQCQTLLGFTPRSECDRHPDAEHYPDGPPIT